MITTNALTISFSGKSLYENVSIKFLQGNCYGLIGANGSGKSTFLKALSGELEATQGNVSIEEGKRIAVLRQDQFAFDEFTVIDTVIMGHKTLYDVYSERNRLYDKDELTDEEGMRIGDLEEQFGEMDGYTAESDAAIMLGDLGISEELHEKKMSELESGEKIRVLLAQALFGNPDILLLDEPTNQLDYVTIEWLENYLLEFENLVIVVSHDRHFLNKVCTHIADVDYGNIKIFPGNYDFWKNSAELAKHQREDKHKKSEQKIQELEAFVRRFSANASKSKQATSRKKLIEKLRPDELPVSTRKSPYINFNNNKKTGTKIVSVSNVTHSIEGEVVLKDVSFNIIKGNNVAIAGRNSISKTTLLEILAGKITPDEGEVVWGESVEFDYFPKDNNPFFKESTPLISWLSSYSDSDDIMEMRSYLGRMLFSGDDANKTVNVLSGGEKARAMFAKIMLTEPNTILFDEPTDHLDLEAISSLNDGMIQYEGTLIFSSQDYEIMNTVANRIIEVSPKGYINEESSFEDFLQSDRVKAKRLALYN
ncbi:ABC transporter ATP-binding protein [Candidatus Marinamargulisbacteria bacterium SCGC AG-414-C22]|nr:ABC transporter ATP-binding protein [Candidatus Marinamargulisbacteria bacterium SCGC AG-414-C22]